NIRHARQGRDVLENFPMRCERCLLRWIIATGQSNCKRQCGTGLETGIDLAELLKALDHKAGRNEKDQRQCDLSTHQHMTRITLSTRRSHSVSAITKRGE